jgi:hypothetical protein
VRSQVRLYAILARKSPLAVIFRRGPSNHVRLIQWNTVDDTLKEGQWFKGRVYERRCDLSPNGELLLYFAAKYKDPLRSWSAVSRPPYFTALALWPKGDGWGGGGRFMADTRIELNHRLAEMAAKEEYRIPKWFKVKPFPGRPGWGEDDPVWSMRLERDGWRRTAFPTKTKDDFGAKVWMEFSPPITWEKKNPKLPKQYSLQMRIVGLREKEGPWWITEHSVRTSGDEVDLGRADWADWSHSGDLLYAKDGRLLRLSCKGGTLAKADEAIEIADFRSSKFEELAPPSEALRWPKRLGGLG